MAPESKRTYFAVLLFALFATSMLALLWAERTQIRELEAEILGLKVENADLRSRTNLLELRARRVDQSPSVLTVYILAFTAIVSALGIISQVIIAWRSEKRSAREQALRIAQLERELKAAKKRLALPSHTTPALSTHTTKKQRKKVR